MADSPSDGWMLHRSIPSDTSVGSSLVSELITAMLKRGWPEDERFRVRLAYEEAIVNAIRHGNGCAADKRVHVRFECDSQVVLIEITDEGVGFDPDSLPDPRHEDNLEVPGGRGVLMINEIMCEVLYSGTGNQVTMIKRRSANASDTAG